MATPVINKYSHSSGVYYIRPATATAVTSYHAAERPADSRPVAYSHEHTSIRMPVVRPAYRHAALCRLLEPHGCDWHSPL